MSTQRALAAIVFTDAVAFSTRVQADEESALQEMQADFSVMREVCVAHGGRVLKSMGDGLLMVFDSASEALDSALEIQRAFADRPAGSLEHRMGVHLCDVVLEANDAHGDGVNLAARLEAEASPGGICLSQTIYDIVKSRLPVQAKFLGERHLKNLVEPVKVFEIAPGNAPRGQKIPPRDNRRPSGGGMAAAIAFLGVSILVAAGVMWFRPMRQPVAQGMPAPQREVRYIPMPAPSQASSVWDQLAYEIGERERFAKYVARARAAASASKLEAKRPTIGQTPESGAKGGTLASQPSVDNGAKASKGSEPVKEAPTPASEVEAFAMDGVPEVPTPPGAKAERLSRNPEFLATWTRLSKDYKFEEMLDAIERNPEWKNAPDYDRQVRHLERLKAFKQVVIEDLEDRSKDKPLVVKGVSGQRQQEVVGANGTEIRFRKSDGKLYAVSMKDLDPAVLRALAVNAAKGGKGMDVLRKSLSSFDREFGTRFRGSRRIETATKAEDPRSGSRVEDPR